MAGYNFKFSRIYSENCHGKEGEKKGDERDGPEEPDSRRLNLVPDPVLWLSIHLKRIAATWTQSNGKEVSFAKVWR